MSKLKTNNLPRIVTIGGGSGQATLLRYLKNQPLDLTAIVSMVDDGGSTGKIRQQYHLPPLGDVRHCFFALAEDAFTTATMEYRFRAGDFAGHPVGNIVLTAVAQMTGSVQAAVDHLQKIYPIQGKIITVTEDLTTLCARLANGDIIAGESNIDIPKHPTTSPIEEVFLKSQASANPRALEAIAQADLIIFTIGDLFTSVIPNLLVDGIAAAIRTTKAPLLYTCNRSTKTGETDHFSVVDYLKTLERYSGGRKVDHVIVHDPQLAKPTVAQAVVCDLPSITAYGTTPHVFDLVETDHATVDGAKLAQAITTLCGRLSLI